MRGLTAKLRPWPVADHPLHLVLVALQVTDAGLQARECSAPVRSVVIELDAGVLDGRVQHRGRGVGERDARRELAAPEVRQQRVCGFHEQRLDPGIGLDGENLELVAVIERYGIDEDVRADAPERILASADPATGTAEQ
jgi:hypothetical protein